MILYKGSKLNLNPFTPQTVHPDDFYKFPKPTPEQVIFASESDIKAKTFATFSGIISFTTTTNPNGTGLTITMRDEIWPETLKEKVYLYQFDSNSGPWKYLEESGEWYSTEEQTPIEVIEYTREELLQELQENPEITFEENFQEKEPIPQS